MLTSIAQSTPVATKVVEPAASYICPDIKNTYQIQLNTRKDIAIPVDICDLIVQNRHGTEIVYYKINDFATVKILPVSKINRANLKELKDYVHVSSDPE